LNFCLGKSGNQEGLKNLSTTTQWKNYSGKQKSVYPVLSVCLFIADILVQ